jgi:hypothetical protein
VDFRAVLEEELGDEGIREEGRCGCHFGKIQGSEWNRNGSSLSLLLPFFHKFIKSPVAPSNERVKALLLCPDMTKSTQDFVSRETSRRARRSRLSSEETSSSYCSSQNEGEMKDKEFKTTE